MYAQDNNSLPVWFIFVTSLLTHISINSQPFLVVIVSRDKAVKQSEFLLEVAEELSDCSFPAVIEGEVGDVSCQGDDVMLCNI